MHTLHLFYRNAIKTLFVALAAFWLGYNIWLLPLVASLLNSIGIKSEWIIGNLSSTAILTVIYFLFERFIRKNLWKFVYPKLNFDGEWEGETRYTSCIDPKKGIKKIEAFTKPQVINFEQDCLTINIANSEKSSFQWHSLALELNNNGDIDMVYEVEYFDKSRGEGDIAFGYENMRIAKKLKSYPIEMRGTFKHCISTNSLMYNGDVTYRRKGRK